MTVWRCFQAQDDFIGDAAVWRHIFLKERLLWKFFIVAQEPHRNIKKTLNIVTCWSGCRHCTIHHIISNNYTNVKIEKHKTKIQSCCIFGEKACCSADPSSKDCEHKPDSFISLQKLKPVRSPNVHFHKLLHLLTNMYGHMMTITLR